MKKLWLVMIPEVVMYLLGNYIEIVQLSETPLVFPARAMDIAKTEDVFTLHKQYVLPVLPAAHLMDNTKPKELDAILLLHGELVLLTGIQLMIVKKA